MICCLLGRLIIHWLERRWMVSTCSVSPCPYPEQQPKRASRGTHSSCPSSCEQPALTPAVPEHDKNGREKAENYTTRGSATAEGEVVTAVGLRDAVLKLIQCSLVMQVRLQLSLMNDFRLQLHWKWSQLLQLAYVSGTGKQSNLHYRKALC